MATRWALVGLMTLAALGCSGSENGRYVPVVYGDRPGVLDTRTGRLCVPRSSTYTAFCFDLGENATPMRDNAATARP